MKNTTKKVYTAPRLTVHGDASKLTQATFNGPVFDRQNGELVSPGDPILMS